MDHSPLLLIFVSLITVATAVVDEAAEVATCSCPWSAEEFSQLQSDVSSLKVEMEDMKKRLEDEEPSNEIPAPEVGGYVSVGDDNRFPIPPRPEKIEGFVYATCKPMPNSELPAESFQPITGIINMKQNASGGSLFVDVYLYGFRSPRGSLHGFHIHTYGDLKEGCQSTGGHYNPFNHDHGGPNDENRHVGDFGNIEPDHQGVVNTNFVDNVASLVGEYSVIGRAFVIHEGEDDLGRGGFPDSHTTGHAGARLACCVIGRSEQ